MRKIHLRDFMSFIEEQTPFLSSDLQLEELMGAPLDPIEKDLETEEEIAQDTTFHENLAEKLSDSALNSLSSFLFEAIEDDATARDELMESAKKILKYAGIESVEDLVGEGGNTKVMPNTLRTFDSTFKTCWVRTYADIVPQLYPPLGPAGFYINGEKDQWGELQNSGEICRDYINYYLTVKDSDYYTDAWKGVLNTIFYGTGFKKIFYDANDVAVSRFISPAKFIINKECSSILKSDRLTHELDLSKREILQRMEEGIYKKVDLPYLQDSMGDDADAITSNIPGQNDVDSKTYRGQFPFYECHAYLNISDFTNEDVEKHKAAVPLPYIITLDKTTKKIVGLYRNWREGDEKLGRVEYFTVMNYMQGLGIYGWGIMHLIGSDAITLTKILRALVDAGFYQNLPAGICSKGMKTPDKDWTASPGTFLEANAVDDIRKFFMPFPFNGPSAALLELYKMRIEQVRELGSVADMGMTESKDNISPMTAVAIMDHATKFQSVVMQSLHFALSRELQMIWNVLKETTDYTEFSLGQNSRVIRAEDFRPEVSIIPVASPEMNSRTTQIMKVQSMQMIAEQFPGLFKQEVIARKMLDAMGLDAQQIDDILFTPEELAESQAAQPQQITAEQLTQMDIEQKSQESQIRLQIAEGQQAAQIFKTETDLQLAAAKLKSDQEVSESKAIEAEQKNEQEIALEMMRQEIANMQARSDQELAQVKLELEKYKADLALEQTELKIEADKEIANFKGSVDLIKNRRE